MKKILILFYLILSFFLALILLLIKPFFSIFIGNFYSRRIGHLCQEGEIVLIKKLYYPFKLVFYYFEPNFKVCNKALKDIIKRNIILINSNIMNGLNFWQNNVLKKKIKFYNNINLRDHYSQNIFNENLRIHLTFTEEEIEYGDSQLEKMGLKNKKYVCFLNRNEKYLDTFLDKDYSYHSYRNSKYENYFESLKFLKEKNFQILKMGYQDNLNLNKNLLFDYSNSKYRSDFMDLFLVYKCHFFLSGGAGLDALTKVYRKPIVSTNLIPIMPKFWPGYEKNKSVFIHKKIFGKKEKKLLTLKEIAEKSLISANRNDMYNNVDLIENDSEEILNAVKQMYNMLNSKFNFEEQEYLNLQIKYWKILFDKELKTNNFPSLIGYSFLKKNNYLLS